MARASVGKVALRNSKRRWFRSNPAAPFAQPFQFSDRRSKPKRSADAAPVYQLEILAQAFVLIVLNDDQSFGIVADGPAMRIPAIGTTNSIHVAMRPHLKAADLGRFAIPSPQIGRATCRESVCRYV